MAARWSSAGKGQPGWYACRTGHAVGLQDGVGGQDVEVGPPRGQPGQRLQAPRVEHVVGVQDHHVVPAGGGDGGVLRRGLAAVRLAQDPDPGVDGLGQGGGAVGRPVVAHDDLERRVRLVQGGGEGVDDRALGLVGGDTTENVAGGRRRGAPASARGRGQDGPGATRGHVGERIGREHHGPPPPPPPSEHPSRDGSTDSSLPW